MRSLYPTMRFPFPLVLFVFPSPLRTRTLTPSITMSLFVDVNSRHPWHFAVRKTHVFSTTATTKNLVPQMGQRTVTSFDRLAASL
jgi:hypothetical protein